MVGRYAAAFLGRRLLAALALLVLISFGSFALLGLAPSNEVQLLLFGHSPTPGLIHSLERQYNLTGSLPSRYWHWLVQALQLHFGQSLAFGTSVSSVIRQRVPVTLELAGMAFVIVIGVGIPLGIASALRRGRAFDQAIVGSSIVGLSLPPFVTGIVLIYVFAVQLGWFPTFGVGSPFFVEGMYHLVLPAIALAVTVIAVVVKVTRAAMARELQQDYVVFALARGESMRRVVFRHVLRNALIPVVTASGLILGYMIVGAVLVEQVFGLPGLGSLIVYAAQSRDVPVLQGAVLVIAIAIIGLNLLADLLYLAIDPRVRFGEAG